MEGTIESSCPKKVRRAWRESQLSFHAVDDLLFAFWSGCGKLAVAIHRSGTRHASISELTNGEFRVSKSRRN